MKSSARVEIWSRQIRSRYTWKLFDSVSTATTGSARTRSTTAARPAGSATKVGGGGRGRSTDDAILARRRERRRDLPRDGRVPLEERDVRGARPSGGRARDGVEEEGRDRLAPDAPRPGLRERARDRRLHRVARDRRRRRDEHEHALPPPERAPVEP